VGSRWTTRPEAGGLIPVCIARCPRKGERAKLRERELSDCSETRHSMIIELPHGEGNGWISVAERVGREQILRQDGYLYFLGKDGYLRKTPTKLNKDGRKARVGSEKINREDGYMYFLDKAGFVSRAKMLNTTSLSARQTSTSAGTGVRTIIHTIERQVVKIRCRHCGNLVNEVEGKCPSCGAQL
jgi:hypothetical protein